MGRRGFTILLAVLATLFCLRAYGAELTSVQVERGDQVRDLGNPKEDQDCAPPKSPQGLTPTVVCSGDEVREKDAILADPYWQIVSGESVGGANVTPLVGGKVGAQVRNSDLGVWAQGTANMLRSADLETLTVAAGLDWSFRLSSQLKVYIGSGFGVGTGDGRQQFDDFHLSPVMMGQAGASFDFTPGMALVVEGQYAHSLNSSSGSPFGNEAIVVGLRFSRN